MSKSIIEIRRKSDGKILRDEINDACQTHNIYDGDMLVESNKDYNIGYTEGVGFCDFSEYEELADYEEQPMRAQKATIKGWVAVDKDSKRQMLLKCLCAMLPYGVIVNIDGYNIGQLKGIDYDIISTDNGINYPLRLVKPYLRPMSSMTKKEKKEYDKLRMSFYKNAKDASLVLIDWLNSHHFDYRGLIEMGLALEAPEGMYQIQ